MEAERGVVFRWSTGTTTSFGFVFIAARFAFAARAFIHDDKAPLQRDCR